MASLEQASRDFLGALKDIEIPEGVVKDEIAFERAGKIQGIKGAGAVLKGAATFVEWHQELESADANKPMLNRVLGDKETSSSPLAALITNVAMGEDDAAKKLAASLYINDDDTIGRLALALNNIGKFEEGTSWRANLNTTDDGKKVDDDAIKESAKEDAGAPPPPSDKDIKKSANEGTTWVAPREETLEFGDELRRADAERVMHERIEASGYWRVLKEVVKVYDRTLGPAIEEYNAARNAGGRRVGSPQSGGSAAS